MQRWLARSLFFPTLGWNMLLGRALRVRHWWDWVDDQVLLGAIVQLGLTTTLVSPTMRLVLATGVMGGFTTYSTFNYETLEYVRQGALGMAGLNVAATLLLCLLGGLLGLAAGRWLAGS